MGYDFNYLCQFSLEGCYYHTYLPCKGLTSTNGRVTGIHLLASEILRSGHTNLKQYAAGDSVYVFLWIIVNKEYSVYHRAWDTTNSQSVLVPKRCCWQSLILCWTQFNQWAYNWILMREIQCFPVYYTHKGSAVQNFDTQFLVSRNKMLTKTKTPWLAADASPWMPGLA